MAEAEARLLNYAAEIVRRHGPLAIIGFVISSISLILPLTTAWIILQEKRGTYMFFRADKYYYAWPATAIILSGLGLPGRRRLFPVLAISFALLAIGATLLETSRTW